MARKKVVFIVKYFYPIKRPSGITSFIFDLAEKISKQVDLSVVSFRTEDNDQKQYQQDRYTIYKVKKPYPLAAAIATNKLKPDAVIIFSGIFKPIQTMIYFGLISLLLGRKKQMFCQATNYQKKNLPKIYACFLKYFNAIIATNNYMFDQYKNLGLNSKLIPPGVNLEEIDQASINKVAKNKEVRIGFFGHYYAIKGPDRLLDTFLKINPQNAEVIFRGGEGPLFEKIRDVALRDKRVLVIDWHDNIVPYIASCDLIVFPYRSSQSVLGFAHAALIAMYLRIPIIGTKTPSLEFLIKDGYNGYIIKDDKELREKLERLINDSAKRKELGENARQTIADNFNIKKIAEDYLGLIYEI